MKIPAFVKVPLVTLTLIYASSLLTLQKAQAHHNPVHSAEQAATKAAVETSAKVEQVAVTAPNTSATLPLAIGGAVLLSFAGLGLYSARKKQSA